MSINKESFGILPDGRESHIYTITNRDGYFLRLTDFGGAVMGVTVPDKNGRPDDVVCGYDTLDSYIRSAGYQGALVGRFGNRIAGGRFTLDGKEYSLFCNNGVNHLHGGKNGFSHRLWNAEVVGDALKLTLTSPDGDEGYPGKLEVTVIYRFTDNCELCIEYSASTDKKTIINLTNHTYFNLGGYREGNLAAHILRLDADSYLPTDEALIPTGEIRSVTGTPLDFRTPKEIGRDINSDDADIVKAGGYDHCLNFTGGATASPTLRGELYCPVTGRVMSLYTDRPCVQLYSGNFLGNPDFPFKGGVKQRKQGALCLETQGMPDSPNHPCFTDASLEAGKIFTTTTVYRFSVIQ